MHKKIILLVLICFLCFVVNGCVVVTYPIRAERVDQSLSRGNRGYLVGGPKICDEESRKTTRQLQVVEIRSGSIKEKTDSLLSAFGDEVSSSTSASEGSKKAKEILVVSATKVPTEPLVTFPEPEASVPVAVLESQRELEGIRAVSAPAIKPVDTDVGLYGAGEVIFGFIGHVPTWEIPDWCFDRHDFVAESLSISRKFAKEGKTSLELIANFPGKTWSAAYVEVEEYFDWTPYHRISADIYLPENVPFGLKAKLILTVGENWQWTEMSRLTKLVPGEWTTITASIVPGSMDWRRTQVTDEFRADVRKVGIRIDSNMRPVYAGPIYIDNVRME